MCEVLGENTAPTTFVNNAYAFQKSLADSCGQTLPEFSTDTHVSITVKDRAGKTVLQLRGRGPFELQLPCGRVETGVTSSELRALALLIERAKSIGRV